MRFVHLKHRITQSSPQRGLFRLTFWFLQNFVSDTAKMIVYAKNL